MSDVGRGGRGQRASGQRGGDRGRARVVGGLHPVRELLRSEQPVTELLLSRSGGAETAEIEQLAAARRVPVVADRNRDELDAVSGNLVHQGVVALAPALPSVTVDHLIARAAAADEPALLVALDHVTDPQNLGSIARTADAVGAHGLILPERRAAGVTPAAEKAAAGAFAHLPVATVANLNRTLALLGERGVWSLGLDGNADDLLADHPLAGEPCVLVVGAEGAGLARLTRERCDALVRLPMRGHVGSLNASVAAGVALYELLRARG